MKLTRSAGSRGRPGLHSWVVCAVLAVALTSAVRPLAGQSRVEGVVRLADSLAVSGVQLELHRVTEESGALVDSTLSDGFGRFGFSLAADGPPTSVYIIGARYKGILYWGPPLHATGTDTLTDYAVAVFDTTLVDSPVTDLALTLRHLVLTPADGGMQVEEILDVAGPVGRTLVSASDSVPSWSTFLPEGAHAVVPLGGGVPPEDVVLGDGTVGYAGPVPPAGVRLVLQYVVAGNTFDLRLGGPTGRMELLVVPTQGMETDVTGLSESRVDESMGRAIRRYTGADLPAEHAVSVQFVWQAGGRRAAWPWLLASGLLGVAALLAAHLSRRNG